eukprot:XP_001689891.1 predicted protein [Chlamydomonas reinhardtii]
MSALAQRQWRQRAQTAVRVAITATKEARTTYQGLSDGGDGAMSDLSNALLQLSHLPGLALPQPLAAMCPDVRAAAAAKLARQQAALAEALADRVCQMAACVEGLARAVEALDQEEPWMRSSPVFHTFPLPKLRQLLAGVVEQYRLEQDSKAAAAAAIAALAVGPAAAAAADAAEAADFAADGQLGGAGTGGAGGPRADARGVAVLAAVSAAGEAGGVRPGGGGLGGGGGAGGGGTVGKLDATRLSELCTTYVSVWMLSPYLEEQEAEEVLGAITEDMVGF